MCFFQVVFKNDYYLTSKLQRSSDFWLSKALFSGGEAWNFTNTNDKNWHSAAEMFYGPLWKHKMIVIVEGLAQWNSQTDMTCVAYVTEFKRLQRSEGMLQ